MLSAREEVVAVTDFEPDMNHSDLLKRHLTDSHLFYSQWLANRGL